MKDQSKKNSRKHRRNRRNRFGLIRRFVPLVCICMSMAGGLAIAVGLVVLAEMLAK